MTSEISSKRPETRQSPAPDRPVSLGDHADEIARFIEDGIESAQKAEAQRGSDNREIHPPPLPEPASGGTAGLADRIVPTERFGTQIADKLREQPPKPTKK